MSETTFAFIYARTDSTRLPRKALLKINELSLIEVVCKRAQRLAIDECVLLTTDRSLDDELAETARKHGISVFRGSTHNLVDRTLNAIKKYKTDKFIRINGDSPFFEPEIIEFALSEMHEGVKFTSNIIRRFFPYGVAVEIVDCRYFRELANKANSSELEHVTKHLYRFLTPSCVVSVESSRDDSSISLTIDTLEDLEKIKEMSISVDLITANYWSLLGLDPPTMIARLL